MILQALVDYYETLAGQGKISRPGWGEVKVSFALYINDEGELEQVASLKVDQVRKGKTVWVPQKLKLPAPVKRASGISPNFLCDNAGYLLGVDGKGDLQRTQDCFTQCKAHHQKILSQADSPAARALLAFFDHWEPSRALEHLGLAEHWDDLLKGDNLVFRYNGGYLHEDAAVRRAWEEYYNTDTENPEMTCLVTGEKSRVEAVHPAVKGVAGAQSSGAALVSFNGEAFCSYGRKQSLNAPVSKYAAFAYTTALNHLLADREHTKQIGKITLLFWAASGQAAAQDCFAGFVYGSPSDTYGAKDLRKMVEDLCQGRPVLYNGDRLDPDMDFYVLGLAPNAARLSVPFFLHNTFGGFLENVRQHYERLEIARASGDKFETISLWRLLNETLNQKFKKESSSGDKKEKKQEPLPHLSEETARAVLENTRYPASLLNGVTLRIRAEQDITQGRAAILKAYYLKNPHPDVPKEVLTVALNPDSDSIPYVLGRLFSVLESIQSAANAGVTTTIKDKYFNSASATPSRIFPTLLNLAQKHLRKLDGRRKVFYDRQLTELCAKLGEEYPDHMNLPQQGAFQLGYYHQTQQRYQKKEDKENG